MDTQLDAELKARILVEALPYIQEYYGQTVVVKYGGNAMINNELKDAVIHDLRSARIVGSASRSLSCMAAVRRSTIC